MGDLELQIFSDRLKSLRNTLGLTQAQFVEDLGITTSALSAYEKNTKNPSLGVAKRIAEKYKVSIDWLVGLSEDKEIEKHIETYSDLIKYLLELQNIKNANVDFFSFDKMEDIFLIVFNNSKINSFFKDWLKIKQLYDSKIIDIDMYEPWLESKLKEYNTPIKNKTLTYSINVLKEILEDAYDD